METVVIDVVLQLLEVKKTINISLTIQLIPLEWNLCEGKALSMDQATYKDREIYLSPLRFLFIPLSSIY